MAQSNVSTLALAAAAWQNSEAERNSGDALALLGLRDAWNSPLFYRLEENSPLVEFTLADYAFPKRNEDGSEDKKTRSAMLSVICRDLFGIAGDIPASVKTGFNRVYGAAALLAEDDTIAVKVKKDGKRNILTNVPLPLAISIYGEDGKLNKRGKEIGDAFKTILEMNGKPSDEAAIIAAVEGATVSADGSEHRIFGKLPASTEMIAKLRSEAVTRKLVAAPKSRAARNPEQVKSFSESLGLVSREIENILKSDEASEAFASGTEKEMFRLQQLLAQYFTAYPMESAKAANA